jgi:hypothetical protein
MTFGIARALAPSGLLGEVVETTRPLTGTYYGYNVTKTDREPIDQVHGFLAASRISRAADNEVPFFPFVAGLFEVVNATSMQSRDELIVRNRALEARKIHIFQQLTSAFSLKGSAVATADMWNDEDYWRAVAELLRDKTRFSRKALLHDTLRWYADEDAISEALSFAHALRGFPVPNSILDRVGTWPAPLLYTPLEVAEAVFLHSTKSVTCKVGHMEERVYDRYIIEWMDLIHLRQPADLKSTLRRPRGVTPYIDKERRDRKIRLYFEDSADDIAERLAAVTEFEYLRTVSDVVGELLHPVVDKAVLAVEAGIAAGRASVSVRGETVTSGMDLISRVECGRLSIPQLCDDVPELVATYINGLIAE